MFLLYRTRVLITYRTSDTLFVPFSLQKSKSLIFIHAARVGNNRHRVFVLLCTRCLKPCLRGVRLQPLAQPTSRRKEAQGENAQCLHADTKQDLIPLWFAGLSRTAFKVQEGRGEGWGSKGFLRRLCGIFREYCYLCISKKAKLCWGLRC